jgi:hypothetical protein
MWRHFYNQYGDISKPENFERCLSMMMRYKRLHKLNPDPDRIRREFFKGKQTYDRLFALLEEHYAEQLGKPRWGDKSLNTERYTDLILEAYPGARIIHMVRDPRDRFSSSLKRWKVIRSGIGGATALWLKTIRLAKLHQTRYPSQYKIVRYEDLAAQPEKTLQDICKFIGEKYEPELLTMKGAKKFRDKGGNSSYGKRKPGKISTSSIGKFQQVLSPSQIAFMQLFSRKTMLDFEYQPVNTPLGFWGWVKFILFDFPLNLTKMLAWRSREYFLNIVGRNLPAERVVSESEARERVHKGSIA